MENVNSNMKLQGSMVSISKGHAMVRAIENLRPVVRIEVPVSKGTTFILTNEKAAGSIYRRVEDQNKAEHNRTIVTIKEDTYLVFDTHRSLLVFGMELAWYDIQNFAHTLRVNAYTVKEEQSND